VLDPPASLDDQRQAAPVALANIERHPRQAGARHALDLVEQDRQLIPRPR
jgi:hypothetical protein